MRTLLAFFRRFLRSVFVAAGAIVVVLACLVVVVNGLNYFWRRSQPPQGWVSQGVSPPVHLPSTADSAFMRSVDAGLSSLPPSPDEPKPNH